MSKKFKLPNMEFSQIVNDSSKTITIKDTLTYDNVKPIIEQILSDEVKISKINCEHINEIDIAGIQFLLSIKKYSQKIIIDTAFADEVNKLIVKAGYKF